MSRPSIYICGIILIALMSFFFLKYGAIVFSMITAGNPAPY